MKGKQQLYKKEMIRQLYFGGSLSCAELSELTGKSLPLATKTLNELVDCGLVQPTGLANSTGGRRPNTYSLVADTMYVLAVAMDQLTTRVALLDMHNNQIGSTAEYALPLANNDHALAELGEILRRHLDQAPIPRKQIIGIGIGMPGFVDVTKGINHSFLKNPGGSLTSYLESVTQLPVFIDNDSSLMALAEYRFGAARGNHNVMVVNIGWGTGLGMIVNGALFRGDSGFAGEFSHIPLFTNNKLCSCGKLGCLETEASLKVLVQMAQEEIRKGKMTSMRQLSTTDTNKAATQILDAAISGDRLAVDLLSEVAYNIGRGIAILIHIMNPGMVVLSGRGAAAGNLWLAPVYQAINENCIPKIAENTSVVVSNLGKKAEVIGAAALVMESLDRSGLMKTLNNFNQRVQAGCLE